MFSHIAEVSGAPRPFYSVPYFAGYAFGWLMETLHPWMGTRAPFLTRAIVHIAEDWHSPTDYATKKLGYRPRVDWRIAISEAIEELRPHRLPLASIEPGGRMSRLKPGDRAPRRVVVDLEHRTWRIPHDGMLYLQFRRFAGCPICNLHTAALAARVGELHEAGIQPLAIFASTREAMLPYQGSLPFPTAPDLERSLYRAYGVESSVGAAIAPKAWMDALVDLGKGIAPPHPERMGAAMIHPADFLIAEDGEIVACHYGEDPHDSWTVDDVLDLQFQKVLDS